MKLYQPLVLQKLDIRVADFHVRQLALHKHLPETTAVQPHKHRFSQFLLYLSGRGRQLIGKVSFKIEAGSLVFLPAQTEHAFHREANRRPICLALDFDWSRNVGDGLVIPMASTVLREARHLISVIAHIEQRAAKEGSLQVSAAILNLLDRMLQTAGFIESKPVQPSTVFRKIEMLLNESHVESISLSSLARKTGYQHDYLNRLLRAEAGLTLGQLRARALLTRAQRLLTASNKVNNVAEALGFNDPNYFSRWFRKQTGMTPKLWKRQPTVSNQ